jgi:hypothetical protein
MNGRSNELLYKRKARYETLRGKIGAIPESHCAGLTESERPKDRCENPCAASMYSVSEHRGARDGRESAAGFIVVWTVSNQLQRNRDEMARNTIDRCIERADRMERRPETSRFGHGRRTSLRLLGQFHGQCSKSFWRLHWQADPWGIDWEWQSDQRPWIRILVWTN